MAHWHGNVGGLPPGYGFQGYGVPVARPTARTIAFGERWEVLVDRRIGEGGFGHVYRAKDKTRHPPLDVAAKRLVFTNSQQRASFETEVNILKKVHDHAFIISLVGEAIVDQDGWMFFEMSTGGELYDRLLDYGSLSERARPRDAPSPTLPKSTPPCECSRAPF